MFTDCFVMGQPPAKRARKVISLSDKLRILERLEAGETASKLAKEYGIGNSTLTDIKKAKEKIRRFAADQESAKSLAKRCIVRTCNDADHNKMLLIWFKQERSKGLPICGPSSKQKHSIFGRPYILVKAPLQQAMAGLTGGRRGMGCIR